MVPPDSFSSFVLVGMYVYGQRGQEAVCFRDQYSFFFSQASIQRGREGRLRAGILEIKAWIYRSKKGGEGGQELVMAERGG